MKYIFRIIGAALLAFLLGVLFALIAGKGQAGAFFFIFSLAGLVAYSVFLLRTRDRHKALFYFSLAFGIEWLLLPIAAWVNAKQATTFGGAIGGGLLLAISLPIGLGAGLLFILLALLIFRPKLKGASGQDDQSDTQT